MGKDGGQFASGDLATPLPTLSPCLVSTFVAPQFPQEHFSEFVVHLAVGIWAFQVF